MVTLSNRVIPWSACGVLLVLSAGCSMVQRVVGLAEDLKGKRVQRAEAFFPPEHALCPGSVAAMAIRVTLEDGRTLTTQGVGGGKLDWDNFTVEARGARLNEDHVIRLPHDPLRLEADPPRVRITARDVPGLVHDEFIPLRFNCSYLADFTPPAARGGYPGVDGASGARGANADTTTQEREEPDGTNSDGTARTRTVRETVFVGDGGDGQDGGDGGDGGNGAGGLEGAQVKVVVKPVTRTGVEGVWLQVRVMTSEVTRSYLLAPKGARLRVKANGGKGGAGGRAGSGGSGGDGGKGLRAGRHGAAGRNGRAGRGGDGGPGGTFTVVLDSALNGWPDRITLENDAGDGGWGSPKGSPGVPGPRTESLVETLTTWQEAQLTPGDEPPESARTARAERQLAALNQPESTRFLRHPWTVASAVGLLLFPVPFLVAGLGLGLMVVGLVSPSTSPVSVLSAPGAIALWASTCCCISCAALQGPMLACSLWGLTKGPQPYWHYHLGDGWEASRLEDADAIQRAPGSTEE